MLWLDRSGFIVPELMTKAVREWLAMVGVKTLFIEPGSRENRYVESLNDKFRDELLDREVFETPLEARVLIERWRRHYNTERPDSSLGYRPPTPETIVAGPPSAPLEAGQRFVVFRRWLGIDLRSVTGNFLPRPCALGSVHMGVSSSDNR